MKILSTTVFRGPNIYALFPVIRHTLDLADLEDWPTSRLGAKFVDDLVETLPGLQEHGCSYREPGGFIRRMREDEGTWLGHVMEHVAIELQNMAGAQVTFGKTRSTDEQGQYDLVYQYEGEQVGLEAGRLAIELLHHLLPRDLQPEEAPDQDCQPRGQCDEGHRVSGCDRGHDREGEDGDRRARPYVELF